MSNVGYKDEPYYKCRFSFNSQDLEAAVVMERRYLYNRDLPYGAPAVIDRLEKWGINNVPSESTIYRILRKNDLIWR